MHQTRSTGTEDTDMSQKIKTNSKIFKHNEHANLVFAKLTLTLRDSHEYANRVRSQLIRANTIAFTASMIRTCNCTLKLHELNANTKSSLMVSRLAARRRMVLRLPMRSRVLQSRKTCQSRLP